MPLFISLKASLNIIRNEKELEINKNNYNDYSKILKDVFAGYKKQGDIGNSNFDFKSYLESENRKAKNNKSVINKQRKNVIEDLFFLVAIWLLIFIFVNFHFLVIKLSLNNFEFKI